MVQPSAGTLASPVRGHRRSRVIEIVFRTAGLSDPGALRPAVVGQCRDPLQAAARRRCAELHLHHHDLRHPGRHHAVGAGAGDVLPGGRSDRRADAEHGGEPEVGPPGRLQPRARHAAGALVLQANRPILRGHLCSEDVPMSTLKPLQIDIVSDVVCPWCYIGKRRIESALALAPDVPVEIHWRPFFLNSWVPREGIGRDEYLTAKFGSVEAYKGIAGRVVAAANEEGLTYRPELVRRQPNTIDCHRLIHWADAIGKSAEMKQRLMELYFRDGGDLTDTDVLVQAAADIGLDADDIRSRLATDEDVALISAQAKDASDKGISGVPTFVFAQKYAVSGAQPAEQLARAIRQVSAEVNAQAAE